VTFIDWMSLAGVLLLLMALSASTLRQLPITTSAIYLFVGLAIGPTGMEWIRIDLRHAVPWLESLTTVAVVVSLFLGGLKLRLPLRHRAWSAAYWLAGPVMLACIAGTALVAHRALGLEAPLALLLAAMLAPTDPVLASAVSVSDAGDRDRMRYGLSGEAGLNDGAAFPFVGLALLWLDRGTLDTAGLWPWLLRSVLWAMPIALVIGFVLGRQLGRLAIWLRSRQKDPSSPSDFLALALIACAYVCAERIGAWGFLAVFAAGVGLRHAEIRVVDESPHPEFATGDPVALGALFQHPPAEHLVAASVAPEELQEPAVAAGVLVAETITFGETAERMLEVLLMVLIGVCLARHWDVRAIPLALVLFVVIRPLATLLFLSRTPTTLTQRFLMGWFGIRGIGSLFYLTYALSHGLEGRDARLAIDLTLSVVALSVILHGASVQPILAYYARTLSAAASTTPQRAGTPAPV
jgi:NhaP-type Na+/H+ or K+/H+ antiporter